MRTCKRCGGSFDWVRKAGTWRPVNADGSAHRCPKVAARPETRQGRTVVGAAYKPSCGICMIPPWEICACSKLSAS